MIAYNITLDEVDTSHLYDLIGKSNLVVRVISQSNFYDDCIHPSLTS